MIPPFAYPHVLWALLPLLALIAWLEWRLPGSSRRRGLRLGVRFAIAALLVVALAGPQTTRLEEGGLRLVVAIDRSESMGLLAREEALAEAQRAAVEAEQAGAPRVLLGFAERAASAWPLEGSTWPDGAGGPWPLAPAAARATVVPEPPPSRHARPAAGLTAAGLAFRPGERGTVLLLTTGRHLSREEERAARALEHAGIRLRAVALPREVPPPPARLQVTGLDVPDRARGPFTVRAKATGGTGLQADLLLDGQSVRRQAVPPSGEILVPDLEAPPGLHEVSLVLRSENEDGPPPVLARRLVVVEPPPRVLAVVADAEASLTRRALSAQGFQVAPLPLEALAAALAPDAPFPEALLLDAASAARLPEAQARALTALIKEGLGLFLEAGDDTDAWTALARSPLAQVLPLTPQAVPPAAAPEPPPPAPPTPETPPEPPEPTGDEGLGAERRPEEALPIALLLVIDRSGSMMGEPLRMAILGAQRAAGALSRVDRLGIMTFAERATVDVPLTRVTRLGDVGWRLAMIQPGGNTDIYAALVRATTLMEKERAPIRHVILLTDGRQTASEALFTPLARRMARAEITLTAVGLGPHHDSVLLTRLVQFSPRGAYFPVDAPSQLPEILTRDTQRVADRRLREAEALAPLPDPERPPAESPPEEPTSPEPPQPGPEAPAPPEPSPPTSEALRLHLLRPHEATRGLDADTLPSVGAPRPAAARRGAALLLARGADSEPVLAAGRVGLGRVMAFTLPPDAQGLAGWDDLGRLLVQAVRSVRAPRGTLEGAPSARLVRTPDGDRLLLDPATGAGAPELRIRLSHPTGREELGPFLPGQTVDLPSVSPGTPVFVEFLAPDGTPAAAPLTYLAADPGDAPPQAGDAEALGARLGGQALADDGPLLPDPVRDGTPEPRWPWALLVAALLLPLDAALHRRLGASP